MNVIYKDGNIVITVPYEAGKQYPKSGSGKSYIVGGSGGFVPVDGTDGKVKLNLSVIQSIPKAER